MTEFFTISFSFWFYLLIFFIAVFLAFFIPGDLLIRKYNLSIFQRLVFGIGIGMVLWGWQGFVFGYLGFRFLSYIYLLALLLLWFKLKGKDFLITVINKANFKNVDFVATFLIILGVSIQLSSVWFNGVYYSKGLYFCCGNLFDNILHIALTNEITKRFPPYEPGMYSVIVQNYHYWGNLVTGELIRIFHLPLIATQNQYVMFLVSLLLGLSGIVFGQLTALGKSFYRWLIFFLYFGGDLIFLLVSFMRKELNFKMGSLEDGAMFLVNPPRAFSIIILFIGISLMIIWLRKREWQRGFLVVMLFGSLIAFKVYTGLFVLSGLAVLAGYFLLKKELRMIFIIGITFIISLIIYLPVNSGSGGLYFTGLHLFENFIVQPWMMLDRLELARRVYLEHHSWLRVIQYEIIFAFVFIRVIVNI